MLKFIIRRLLVLIPVLLGVSVMIFLIIKLIPGDAAVSSLGAGATQENVRLVRQALHLDRPIYIQYWEWLNRALRGDLGMSIALNTPVASVIVPKFLNTVILTLGSLVVAVGLGLLTGLVAGTRQYSAFDRISMFLALVGASMPVFWLGLILMSVFSLKLGWLPSTGMYDIRGDGGFIDLLKHLILPSIATATVSTAVIARLSRSTLIEVLHADFIKALRAKGLPESTVILRHGVRNGLPPIINITGLQVGYLLGGALFTEVVFSWPGIGLQLYSSITARDIPMVQAATLFVAVSFVVVNLLSDVVIAFLDPTIREGAEM